MEQLLIEILELCSIYYREYLKYDRVSFYFRLLSKIVVVSEKYGE